MMMIRPVCMNDLPGLVALAESAGTGLTTLPSNRGLLRTKIKRSIRAFEAEVLRPRGEVYLLVMEDLLTGEVVGTAGILARVGGFEPFYSYRVKTAVRHSEQLGVHSTVRYLQLDVSHKGPSEIGTLFLRPDARGGGNGRLLSLARFMLMAAQRHRFAPEVIAEMRGVLNEGCSPFWRAVGSHFFNNMPFAQADELSAADKGFIGDLMPKHPIYIPMLPPEVQAVVGQVHRDTEPALRLLEQEGFTCAEQVDIFDAGPMVEAQTERVRTIRESRLGLLTGVGPVDCARPLLISNDQLDIRVVMGCLDEVDDGVVLPRDVVLALGIRLGDTVRYAPSRGRTPARPS